MKLIFARRPAAHVLALALALLCALPCLGAGVSLKTQLALQISADAHGNIDATRLQQFYSPRGFAPVWLSDRRDAKTVQRTLLSASDEGLEPEDYHASEIAQLDQGTPEDQVQRELLLTDGLLKYAHDVRLGRIAPNEVDGDVDLPTQSFDTVAALQSALAEGALQQFLADLPPPHPEYAALRAALKRYRQIAAQGGWPEIVSSSSDLGAHPNAQQDIWTRLSTEDPSLVGVAQRKDSDALAQAIKSFQARNGLEPDGKLGPHTSDALNVSTKQRIQQIAANMERWRWLPRSFGPDYVEVNVPDASLIAVRADKIVLTSRLVVGRPGDPTPILNTNITGVTVNPPWDVPMSIARREYLPALKRDPSYLARHHMFIKDRPSDPAGATIAWRQIAPSDFDFHLRQAPGADNALGRLKLELPNRFSVYLHDTPNTNLFANNDRDLSHGCMRVERILALASVVLSGDPETKTAKLQELIDSGKTQTLPLAKPLPIYVLYWTAFTSDAGETEFRRDVYGRDQRLLSALGGRSAGSQVAKAVGCPLNAG